MSSLTVHTQLSGFCLIIQLRVSIQRNGGSPFGRADNAGKLSLSSFTLGYFLPRSLWDARDVCVCVDRCPMSKISLCHVGIDWLNDVGALSSQRPAIEQQADDEGQLPGAPLQRHPPRPALGAHPVGRRSYPALRPLQTVAPASSFTQLIANFGYGG